MTQDKAQPAVNGYSLNNKGCNAVLGHLWAFLRARRARYPLHHTSPNGTYLRGSPFVFSLSPLGRGLG